MTGATGPHRSTTEVSIQIPLTAELVVHTEDGASTADNLESIEHQKRQAIRDANKYCTDFENFKLED